MAIGLLHAGPAANKIQFDLRHLGEVVPQAVDEAAEATAQKVPSSEELPGQQLFMEDIVNERSAQPVQVVEPTVTVEVAPRRKKS